MSSSCDLFDSHYDYGHGNECELNGKLAQSLLPFLKITRKFPMEGKIKETLKAGILRSLVVKTIQISDEEC